MSFKKKYIEWCVRRDKGWSPGVLTYFDEDFDNFMEDLINSVLIDMKNTKLIFEDHLFYYEDDKGIFLRMFYSIWLDREMRKMRKKKPLRALAISGAHAYGTGAIFAMESQKLGKGLPEFTKEERDAVFSFIGDREPYGLMLELQGIDYSDKKKKYMDALFVDTVFTMRDLATDLVNVKDYQREYMAILFNAGISYIIRYNDCFR